MNVHFACLFGVDYELDLLPFWGPYYQSMGFDTMKVFLNREKGPIGDNIKDEFKQYGFSVEVADGCQANGILRKLVIGYHASTLPPNDFLVTADADEFQSMPDSIFGPSRPVPVPYRELLECFDVLTGYMRDRYTDRLEECFDNPFVQFPQQEPFTRDVLKNFTPPFLQKTGWPYTRRTKILATKAGYPVAYEGSHCFREIPSNAVFGEDYQVIHFAWRESAKRKAAVKSYFTADNLNEIFGGKAPDEYVRKLKVLSPGELIPNFEFKKYG